MGAFSIDTIRRAFARKALDLLDQLVDSDPQIFCDYKN